MPPRWTPLGEEPETVAAPSRAQPGTCGAGGLPLPLAWRRFPPPLKAREGRAAAVPRQSGSRAEPGRDGTGREPAQEAAGNVGQPAGSAFSGISLVGTGADSNELSERHWGFFARGLFVQGGSAK